MKMRKNREAEKGVAAEEDRNVIQRNYYVAGLDPDNLVGEVSEVWPQASFLVSEKKRHALDNLNMYIPVNILACCHLLIDTQCNTLSAFRCLFALFREDLIREGF